MSIKNWNPINTKFNTNMRTTAEKHGMSGALIAVALVAGEMRDVGTVRVYRNPSGKTCTVGFWLYTNGAHAAGMGRVAGSGYHRASAAFQRAAEQAGITFQHEITSDAGIKNALIQICEMSGHRNVIVVEC